MVVLPAQEPVAGSQMHVGPRFGIAAQVLAAAQRTFERQHIGRIGHDLSVPARRNGPVLVNRRDRRAGAERTDR